MPPSCLLVFTCSCFNKTNWGNTRGQILHMGHQVSATLHLLVFTCYL